MEQQLDINTTYRAILEAAREHRFISYSELAKANNVDWQKKRYDLFRQLGDLIEISAGREWPLPSSIVVNQSSVETGALEGTARDGFINAAEQLGYDVSDPDAFIKEQQDGMFAWAATAPNKLELTPEEQAKLEKPAKPKKAKNNRGPQFVRLFGPLLDAMRTLGGSVEPRQAYEEIAKSPLVTDEDLKATNKNGLSKYENQVGWAKFYLAKAGLIDSKKRGVWQLTAEGRETHLDQEAAYALFRDIHARYKTANEEEADEEAAPTDDDAGELFDDPNRQFWFVGAVWNGTDDQTERFFNEGIWQNGYHDKFNEHVERMKPGDRIAIDLLP